IWIQLNGFLKFFSGRSEVFLLLGFSKLSCFLEKPVSLSVWRMFGKVSCKRVRQKRSVRYPKSCYQQQKNAARAQNNEITPIGGRCDTFLKHCRFDNWRCCIASIVCQRKNLFDLRNEPVALFRDRFDKLVPVAVVAKRLSERVNYFGEVHFLDKRIGP